MSVREDLFIIFLICATVAGMSLSAETGSAKVGYIHEDGYTPTRCRVKSGPGLDCSYRRFDHVPNSTFPDDLKWLDLSHNVLTMINNGTFLGQAALRYIDMSFNQITTLQVDAFKGLKHLERLILGFNKLPFSKDTYTSSLMRNIPNLRILHIEGNVDTMRLPADAKPSCPSETFREMNELNELYTDIPPSITIGDCFGKLRNLQTLSSGSTWHGCNLNKLTNSTFDGFAGSALRELRLIYCRIVDIESDAFEPLHELSILDLTYNQNLTLNRALSSLYSLQGKNMTEISLQHVNSDSSKFENFQLSSKNTKYLETICVRYIDISSNYIFYIDDEYLPRFGNPECLQKFRMQKHAIRVIPLNFLLYFVLATRLEWVDVSGGFSQQSDRGLINGNQQHSNRWNNKINSVPFPHSVISLNVSHLITWVTCGNTDITFSGAQRLRNLDASYDSITDCRCAIKGLEGLVNLNISGSDCSTIAPRFLRSFPNLITFTFRESRLNIGLEVYGNGDIFSWLTRLQYIDLSKNDFLRIHPDTFKTMTNLSTVYLQNNKFQSVPLALFNVPNLRFLDLSDNVISYLEPKEMKYFDKLNLDAIGRESRFILDISGNPLSCTCETLRFLDWVLNTKVDLTRRPYLNCSVTNGTTVTFHALKDELKDLEIRCVSQFWLIFSIVACSCGILLVVASVVAYRYRWHIRYWFLTQCRNGYEPIVQEFEYDGFVCYNHQDYHWVVHRLRPFLEEGTNQCNLCLHHRDFPAGLPIQQNIVDAINASRKILLVITKSFVTCDWGEYEIEMAGMRSVREGGDNLMIAILLEDIPVRQMPKVVLNLWHRITFLVWSDSPPEQKIFWERLEKAMKK